ncbi:sodium/potassium/calcium exchanger 4-like isoform X2 [Chelonus insularis]|uniref:sodium/potassium/calcium exchanger 4-like isoform X2 n=1 Tax=Chelonus insularis TaxID=460826 RepID=UPI00158F594B|nr:sodium/potassium/calcium exchanger 4-like isoform X2 [Chelonus insularis]
MRSHQYYQRRRSRTTSLPLLKGYLKRTNSCTPHSIDDFPEDYFTKEQRKQGAVILHTFFGFYCFLLTAYVCNDYLLPSLDMICSELKISADVAGATFLATASCFPELFVNVVGTFLTESDLGVGTVVGGAVFNTFATPAFGALSAAQAIQLDARILSRDCIIYVISVSALVIVMWDGRITWYEAMILMILFTAYFTFLFLNNVVIRCSKKIKEFLFTSSSLTVISESKGNSDDMLIGSYRPFVHGELRVEYRKSIQNAKKKEVECGNCNLEICEKLEEYVEPDTPFTWPEGNIFTKFWFIFTWPLKIILFVSIPDTRFKRFRNWYPITFTMCVIWIAISSYLVSWMMTVVGDTLGISDSVMGITFLSAGGNMPELVSIVILSRQGNGDMAMSNTLGANTLDVLMCLGLPWTIKSIMTKSDVIIESGALAYSVMSIVICVVGFYGVTAFYKYQLNRQVGIACLIMYILFLTFAIMMESHVFFPTTTTSICNN